MAGGNDLILVLSFPGGLVEEGIPRSLATEAHKALPDTSEARATLSAWLAAERAIDVTPDELRQLEVALVAVAHEDATELGKLGWLPPDAHGRVVGGDEAEASVTSSVLVMALALRRMLTLVGDVPLGMSIRVVEVGAGTGA